MTRRADHSPAPRLTAAREARQLFTTLRSRIRESLPGHHSASHIGMAVTTAVTACFLFISTVAAPAQEFTRSSAPSSARSTQGTKPTMRSAARPTGSADSTIVVPPSPHVAPRPPASQPSATRGVHVKIGESPIRRDPKRKDAPPAGPGSRASGASAPGFGIPRVAGALAVVLALIFALRWLLRRSLNAASLPGATTVVQLLSRSPLSPRQHLLLVRVGRRLLVVSDSNGQLSSLSEISDPDEVAALIGQLRDQQRVSPAGTFGNLLGMWRRGGEDEAHGEADTEALDAASGENFPRATPDLPDRGGHDRYADDERADTSGLSTHKEIHGLMERVRLISNQFKE